MRELNKLWVVILLGLWVLAACDVATEPPAATVQPDNPTEQPAKALQFIEFYSPM